MTLQTTTTDHHRHPTTTETQCCQYLSCYWPDFDETLNLGSWEHLEEIPIVHIRNKLVLHWAKLSSNWDWTSLKIRFMASIYMQKIQLTG